MKILHISKYYMPFIGGIEQTARDLVLSLRGVAEQKLICFDHRPHSGDSVDHIDSVEVIRCGQQLLVASQALSLSYGRKLRSLMREFPRRRSFSSIGILTSQSKSSSAAFSPGRTGDFSRGRIG